MLKVMVFIDHLNFDIALQKYYSSMSKQCPKLDYNKIPVELVKLIPNGVLIKTFLFVPKPDDFLMKIPKWKNYYDWVNGMNNQNHFDVIEGSYVARIVDDTIPMDINNKRTYYTVEKGSDINMAVHLITKAFHNSYDIAVIVSGDTDYLMVLNILSTIGKNTVITGVKGQNLSKLIKCADSHIIMDDDFFQKCLR